MYLVWAGSQDTYTRYLGTYVPGLHPPQKNNRRPMKLLQKNKIKNNLNTELTEMGVFSAVAGNQLPNQMQKRVLPALFHLRCPSQSCRWYGMMTRCGGKNIWHVGAVNIYVGGMVWWNGVVETFYGTVCDMIRRCGKYCLVIWYVLVYKVCYVVWISSVTT